MHKWILCAAAAVCLCASARPAQAQTDEIQVYDAELAPPGKFNLTWHNNYTPEGIATPAFPSSNVADKSFNGVTEWAYGVTQWFEAGLYLPLYSVDKNLGATYNGFKLRALFAVPHAADRTFFYGANFEFSINQKHWDDHHFSSEVRPIIGWHLKPWDFIINPILDTEYDGFKNLTFAPASRIAYNFNEKWALAAEEYADYGPVHGFSSAPNQSHQLYAVVDHTMKLFEFEAGIGFGLTPSSDQVTIKLLIIKDLN